MHHRGIFHYSYSSRSITPVLMNGGFDLRQWNGPFIVSHTECSLAERKEPEMLVRICGPWLPSIYLGHELRSKYLKNVEINYSTSSRYKEQFSRGWERGRSSSHAGWKTMMNDDRMYLEASPTLSLTGIAKIHSDCESENILV